jgi:adenylate cyclase
MLLSPVSRLLGYDAAMRSILLKLIIPLLLWIGLFSAAVALNVWGGTAVSILRVRAAEWLMVQPGGPRLGRRPADQDIALVLFDVKTAVSLGYVRSYSDDLKVYRRLIQAGAKVVYDTRSCAAARPEEFTELKPLLDGMLDLPAASSSGSGVLREIYLSASVLEGGIEHYATLSASNPLNRFPHALPAARVRLYPLAYVDSFGNCESAPLAIARRCWNLPHANSTQVAEELYRSGVITEWHRQYPEDTSPSEEPPSSYRLGQAEIAWHAFVCNSILVLPGGFWVSYDVNCLDYPRLSYLDVLQAEKFNESELKGKVVMIGYSLDVDPGNEIYEVPSGAGKASAAEVVALATQTLLDGHSMKPIPDWLELLLAGGLCGIMAGLATWLRPLEGLSAALLVLLLYFLGLVLAYRADRLGDFVIAPSAAALTAVVCGTYGAWRSHRVHGRVMDLFGRYVPRAVVNQLMLKPELDALQLGGALREVSVLFADVRGFTTFAEKLPPDQVVQELNRLLREMVECTFEHEGTLDKFIGDAILVLFNAPLDQPDHVARAVRAAMDMQRRLGGMSGSLSVGIGLHVGRAVVGNIGTPQRMEYTAIGNTVNIASRLCDYAQGGSVIISQAVADRLSGEFELQPHRPIQVKGLSQPVEVWEVRGPATSGGKSPNTVKGDS